MTTALKIIERAFSKAGVRAAETPLSDSEVADGLDALNVMLESWNATGTLKGVDPVADSGTNLREPGYATWALQSNLAIILAGEYGVEVSPGLGNEAAMTLRDMISASINLQNLEFPSTLPIGSGEGYFSEDDKRNF